MLIGSEELRGRLWPGAAQWRGGGSSFTRSPPAEGGFRFERVTVGIVLAPLPSHHAAYGGDRRRPLPLLPGQGWLFPAGFEGWCRWDEPNDFLNVEIESDLLAEFDARVVAPLSGTLDPLVAQLALHLHAADEESSLYRETLAAALAARIANIAAEAEVPRPTDPRLLRAIDYLEAHLAADVSLDALASVAAMSRFHFVRRFRAATGLSPHAYLIARRIERAKALLRTTVLPIAEIAWQVGYANPAKFAAQFRRLTGAAPGAWRGH